MEIQLSRDAFSEFNKEEKYTYVHQAIASVCENEPDLTANLANISAIFKEVFQWWWCGFYIVRKNELVLGPFQGPLACTRIAPGKGVCGQAWQQKKSLVVPDVELFPGHIACSAASRSEIVIPIIREGKVLAVFDADSEHLSHFDETDRQHLESIFSKQPSFTAI